PLPRVRNEGLEPQGDLATDLGRAADDPRLLGDPEVRRSHRASLLGQAERPDSRARPRGLHRPPERGTGPADRRGGRLVTATAVDTPSASRPAAPESPYRGLRPYTEAEAAFF